METRTDQIKELLANRVRARRNDLRMSQETLADLAGIDRTYASQIERGVANPSLDVLCRLSDALQMGLPEMLAS